MSEDAASCSFSPLPSWRCSPLLFWRSRLGKMASTMFDSLRGGLLLFLLFWSWLRLLQQPLHHLPRGAGSVKQSQHMWLPGNPIRSRATILARFQVIACTLASVCVFPLWSNTKGTFRGVRRQRLAKQVLHVELFIISCVAISSPLLIYVRITEMNPQALSCHVPRHPRVPFSAAPQRAPSKWASRARFLVHLWFFKATMCEILPDFALRRSFPPPELDRHCDTSSTFFLVGLSKNPSVHLKYETGLSTWKILYIGASWQQTGRSPTVYACLNTACINHNPAMGRNTKLEDIYDSYVKLLPI